MGRSAPPAIRTSRKAATTFPILATTTAARTLYRETSIICFSEYRHFSEEMFGYLQERTPKPEEMKQDAYERTLRARAFDLSRYLLPLATNTSLGQIVSARTLETQVSRLLSHTHAEVRRLGELLATRRTGAGVQRQPRESARVAGADQQRLFRHRRSAPVTFCCATVRVAPTLMKYAEPNAYEIETRRELTAAAASCWATMPIDDAPTVDLLDDDPLEIELAATLLYQYSHHPYRQISDVVGGMSDAQRRRKSSISGLRHRGRFDEVSRAFCSGQQFRFDILMDIGGFRDMHRHRRCVQIMQDYTTAHGYDMPEEIEAAGLAARYDATMRRCTRYRHSARQRGKPMRQGAGAIRHSAGLPQAHAVQDGLGRGDLHQRTADRRRRTFFLPQCRLRHVRGGCATVSRAGKYFRVTDVREPVDLLKR